MAAVQVKQKEEEAAKKDTPKEPEQVNEQIDDDDDDKFEECNYKAKVLYDYTAASDNELSIKKDQIVTITEKHMNGWLLSVNEDNQSGFIPETFVKQTE